MVVIPEEDLVNTSYIKANASPTTDPSLRRAVLKSNCIPVGNFNLDMTRSRLLFFLSLLKCLFSPLPSRVLAEQRSNKVPNRGRYLINVHPRLFMKTRQRGCLPLWMTYAMVNCPAQVLNVIPLRLLNTALNYLECLRRGIKIEIIGNLIMSFNRCVINTLSMSCEPSDELALTGRTESHGMNHRYT